MRHLARKHPVQLIEPRALWEEWNAGNPRMSENKIPPMMNLAEMPW
jgi:hypothetical protein